MKVVGLKKFICLFYKRLQWRESGSLKCADLWLDPVDVGRNLGVDSRVGGDGARLTRPGDNSNLLSVHNQGTARITLKLFILQEMHSLFIISYLRCTVPFHLQWLRRKCCWGWPGCRECRSTPHRRTQKDPPLANFAWCFHQTIKLKLKPRIFSFPFFFTSASPQPTTVATVPAGVCSYWMGRLIGPMKSSLKSKEGLTFFRQFAKIN